MDNDEFEHLIKFAGLSKKEFAEINKLHQNSVSNWRQKEIPGWVKPWLENYVKGQAFEKIKNTVQNVDLEYKIEK